MAVIYSDAFERANSTNTPGTPDVGGPYTVRAGTWGINGAALYTSASTAEAQITFPGAIDFDWTVRYKVYGNNPGLIFRWIDASNFWLLTFGGNNSGVSLTRRTSGTYGPVATHSRLPVSGDLYRLVVQGRQIDVYRNGMLIMTTEDGFANLATATMGYRTNSEVNSRFDDSVASTVTAVTKVGADAPTLSAPGDSNHRNPFLYKGRDTKLADQGAVA